MRLSRTYIYCAFAKVCSASSSPDPCVWFGWQFGGRPTYCDPVTSTCAEMYWTDLTFTVARFGPPGITELPLAERRVTCAQAQAMFESVTDTAAAGYDAEVDTPTQAPKRHRGRSNSGGSSATFAGTGRGAADAGPSTTSPRPAARKRRNALATTSSTTTTTTTTTTTPSSVTISAHLEVVDSLIRLWLLPAVQSYPHIALDEPQLGAMREFLELVSYDSVVSFLVNDITTTTTPSYDDEDEDGDISWLSLNTPTEPFYDQRFKHYFYERLNRMASFSDLISFINTHVLEYVSVARPSGRITLAQASQWFHLLADLSTEAIDEDHRPPYDWNGDVDLYFAPFTLSQFPRMYSDDYGIEYEPLDPTVVDPATPDHVVDEIVGRIGQFVDQLNAVDMLLRDMDDFQAPEEYRLQLDNLDWIFSRYSLPTLTVEDLTELGAEVPDTLAMLIYLFRNEICDRIHRIANFVQWAANSPAARPRNARIISRVANNCQSISPISRRIIASQYTFSLRHYNAEDPFRFAHRARFEIRYPRFETPYQVVSRSVRELARPNAYLLGDFVVVELGNPEAGEIGIRRQWVSRMVDDIMRVGAAPRWDLFEYTDDRRGWMRPKPFAPNATEEDRVIYSERFRLVGRILGIALKYDIVPGVRLAPSVIALLRWGSSSAFFANSTNLDRFLVVEDPQFSHGLNALQGLDESVRDTVLSTFDYSEVRPNGAGIEVNSTNLAEYIRMRKQKRLITEIAVPVTHIARGISDVIGRAALDMFTHDELMNMIVGPLEVTAGMVTQGILFKHGVTPEAFPPAQSLLDTIAAMTEENRREFLFFVTSLRTPPINAHEGPWIRVVFDMATNTTRLPRSQTCFNEITLPPYESFAKMQERILTAIAHAGTIENN